MNGKHWLLTIVIALGMLLTVSAEGIAPDSTAPPDSGTQVTTDVTNPRITNCSIWNAGPNGVVNLDPFVDDIIGIRISNV